MIEATVIDANWILGDMSGWVSTLKFRTEQDAQDAYAGFKPTGSSYLCKA